MRYSLGVLSCRFPAINPAHLEPVLTQAPSENAGDKARRPPAARTVDGRQSAYFCDVVEPVPDR